MLASLREAVRDKLVHARAVLEQLRRRVEPGATAMESQKSYVKALEEMLDLPGLTLRRYPRCETVIPSDIAQMVPKKGASGQIVDLSLGGCCLVTPMELSLDAVVGLYFRLPEKSMTVALHGVVRRAQRCDEECVAGVQFMAFPEDIAEALGVTIALGSWSASVNPWRGRGPGVAEARARARERVAAAKTFEPAVVCSR